MGYSREQRVFPFRRPYVPTTEHEQLMSYFPCIFSQSSCSPSRERTYPQDQFQLMTCHSILVFSRFLTWHSKVRCNCSGKLRRRFRNISKHKYIYFLYISIHLHIIFFLFFLLPSLPCSSFCFSTTAPEFYRLTSHVCLSHTSQHFRHYSSITLQYGFYITSQFTLL